MKRIIICITLFAIALLVAIPTMASAEVTPRKIECGTGLKLSHASHRVKVHVYTGKRMVLKRTMRANHQFGKHLACGKRYRAVYHTPSGNDVTRQFKVLSDEDSSDEFYADDEEAGTDLSEAEQLEDDRIWAEMEAEDQAEEACETINEPHEDDENWDSFACMDAYYASIGESTSDDDPGDDSDDDNSDEGDE